MTDVESASFGLGIAGFMLVFFIITYLVMVIPIYLLAKKADDENPYFAFIPFLNIWQMVRIAKIENKVLWFILAIIPYVNIVGGIYICVKYLNAFGRSGWMVLLLFVPLVGFIYYWYLALDENVEYVK